MNTYLFGKWLNKMIGCKDFIFIKKKKWNPYLIPKQSPYFLLVR